MSHPIRPLADRDRSAWDRLWAGYLAFYRQSLPAATSDETFRRLLAGEQGMFAFVAVDEDDRPIGLVHALLHASTWAPGGVCYLQDLFVDPDARGGDVARRLIEAVADEAGHRGAVRVYWRTQQYNGRARSLYDRVARLSSMVTYERDLPAD
ncbi:GNAT family N-acetyltransferase [Patulibacter defluvii]|uniref:GNAT family N-acetyltransferase n=1 Tax=Patulibacter defluvii TaxID=3095358 RepID=UPI002A75D7B0|nr:GNAT family N-acetyltransferase [Patulibacter sp. DM4]